jgi:RNase P subunit RPR2
MKQPVKCECGKRIADRDEKYIYIFCKNCKRIHKYKIQKEPEP